jgi:hypothetical protein
LAEVVGGGGGGGIAAIDEAMPLGVLLIAFGLLPPAICPNLALDRGIMKGIWKLLVD